MVDDLPIDVYELVRRCGGQVDEDATMGFAGAMLPIDPTFGILVNELDSRRRQRFTVAHELGHFCIQSHKNSAVLCIAPETSWSYTDKRIEREANAFAAELLMPSRLLDPALARGAVDLVKAQEIANLCDVSDLAAAIRMCETTQERAAVVMFENGRLAWHHRGKMPYGLPGRGSPPPAASIARDVVNNGDSLTEATEVDVEGWLPLGRPDPSWGTMLESSAAVGGRSDVLTVLWLTELTE